MQMVPWLNLLELLKTTMAPKLCTTVVLAVLFGLELLIKLCFSYSYFIIFIFTRVHVLFLLNYLRRWCFQVCACSLVPKTPSAAFTTLISHNFLSNVLYVKHALSARTILKGFILLIQASFPHTCVPIQQRPIEWHQFQTLIWFFTEALQRPPDNSNLMEISTSTHSQRRLHESKAELTSRTRAHLKSPAHLYQPQKLLLTCD